MCTLSFLRVLSFATTNSHSPHHNDSGTRVSVKRERLVNGKQVQDAERTSGRSIRTSQIATRRHCDSHLTNDQNGDIHAQQRSPLHQDKIYKKMRFSFQSRQASAHSPPATSTHTCQSLSIHRNATRLLEWTLRTDAICCRGVDNNDMA